MIQEFLVTFAVGTVQQYFKFTILRVHQTP